MPTMKPNSGKNSFNAKVYALCTQSPYFEVQLLDQPGPPLPLPSFFDWNLFSQIQPGIKWVNTLLRNLKRPQILRITPTPRNSPFDVIWTTFKLLKHGINCKCFNTEKILKIESDIQRKKMNLLKLKRSYLKNVCFITLKIMFYKNLQGWK